MPSTQTIEVPHLGGISAAYQTSGPVDSSKPTLILINSFTTSSELYRDAYKNEALTSVMNLVAIELLGHGQTRAKAENWTYWDTAIMNLQVMEKLGVKKAFVLGTSQGGWVTVRMALLAPEKVCRLPRSCSAITMWDVKPCALLVQHSGNNIRNTNVVTPRSSA
jgi:pimeloyl-ACP methyl ester carboxylesterase